MPLVRDQSMIHFFWSVGVKPLLTVFVSCVVRVDLQALETSTGGEVVTECAFRKIPALPGQSETFADVNRTDATIVERSINEQLHRSPAQNVSGASTVVSPCLKCW